MGIRNVSWVLMIVSSLCLMAACGKSDEPVAPDEPAAAAPAEEQAPPNRVAELCEKLKPAVAAATGMEVSGFNMWDDEDFPIRCIYQSADPKFGTVFFEIAKGTAPDAARENMKAAGSVIHELPDLGAGAFSTEFSFLNWVVAPKGDTLISTVGNLDVPKLQVLWTKVADQV